MSSIKPVTARKKADRKKLTLSKETLKDLTAKHDALNGAGIGANPITLKPYRCCSESADCSF